MLKKVFEKSIALVVILAIFLFGLFLTNNAQRSSCGDNLCGYFLDVGQGDAALIAKQDNQILIDGGPDKAVLTGLGEAMPPFDKEIEAIIVTHPHADHISGLNYVLDRYAIKNIYLTGQEYETPEYESLLDKIRTYGIPTHRVVSGESLVLDGIEIKFLWPLSDGVNTEDPNSASVVTVVRYGNTGWLYLGDLPGTEQEVMLEKVSVRKVDVLKVAHHGSKNGLSAKLLEVAAPGFAIISVGAANKFGHPASSILDKLVGINTLRTDQFGTIKIMSDGKKTLLLR